MDEQEITELTGTYFDVQAKIGITKHMGGLKATKELAELCQIDKQKYVLIVGCGSGISACWIAKTYGCSITGIDLSRAMVQLSSSRADRKGLKAVIDFSMADVQALPFKDNVFDTVISESVTAFSEDKAKVLGEYIRVLKKGGYVGLNEVTWMRPPSKEMVEYGIRAIGGVKPETAGEWERLMRDSGLQDIEVRTYKLEKITQAINEVRMNGITTSFKAMCKMIWLYITKPACRKAMNDLAKNAMAIPGDFMKFYGYGIYSGKKPV